MNSLAQQVTEQVQEPAELLLHVLQEGLPIVERPYAAIAEELGWS